MWFYSSVEYLDTTGKRPLRAPTTDYRYLVTQTYGTVTPLSHMVYVGLALLRERLTDFYLSGVSSQGSHLRPFCARSTSMVHVSLAFLRKHLSALYPSGVFSRGSQLSWFLLLAMLLTISIISTSPNYYHEGRSHHRAAYQHRALDAFDN